MSATDLDPRPARALTDREIVKLVMGTVGGLSQFCDLETVRRAVRWISETEEVWEVFRRAQPVGEQWAEHLVAQMRGESPPKKGSSS